FTENGSAVTLASAVTITDPDNTTLASATVTIASPLTGDTLAFTPAADVGNIAVQSNAGGVLTLTSSGSSATLTQWQNALLAVMYSSTSDNPTNFGAAASRTITWQVNDGAANSTTGAGNTSSVAITAVNDAPVVTTTNTALSYTENDPASNINPGIT